MRVTRESRTSDVRLSFSEELQYLELYAVKKCDVFQRIDYTPEKCEFHSSSVTFLG